MLFSPHNNNFSTTTLHQYCFLNDWYFPHLCQWIPLYLKCFFHYSDKLDFLLLEVNLFVQSFRTMAILPGTKCFPLPWGYLSNPTTILLRTHKLICEITYINLIHLLLDYWECFYISHWCQQSYPFELITNKFLVRGSGRKRWLFWRLGWRQT